MYSTMHRKVTSGHAWMRQLAGVRKTTALIQQMCGPTADLLSDSANMKAVTASTLSSIMSLFRVAVHPIHLCSGGAWFASVSKRNKSIVKPGWGSRIGLFQKFFSSPY